MESNSETLDTQNLLYIRDVLLHGHQSDSHPDTRSKDFNSASGGGALLRPGLDLPNDPRNLMTTGLRSGENNSHRATRDINGDARSLLAVRSSPLHGPTSNERIGIAKMNQTFAGFPGEIGDTQPMDTQVVKQYSDLHASRIAFLSPSNPFLLASSHAPEKPVHNEEDIQQPGDYEIPPPVQPVDEDSVSSILSDLEDCSSQQGVQEQHGDKVVFKTPAMAGKKRDYRGEVITPGTRTSATKTPGSDLAAMFGTKMATTGLSLTQVFQGTQVMSSPVPGALKSDPVFHRPSPNLLMQDSNPAAVEFSSPTKATRCHAFQASSDPLDNYTSMKESQEERQRRLRLEQEEAARLKPPVPEDFEESFLIGERHGKLRKTQEEVSADTALRSAPKRSSRPFNRKPSVHDRSDWTITPPTEKRAVSKMQPVIEISDELNAEEDGDYSDDERNKKTSALQVPMTSSRPLSHSEAAHRVASSPLGRTRSKRNNSNSGLVSVAQSGRQLVEPDHDPTTTQLSDGIADSQQDPGQLQDSMQLPMVEIPSSMLTDAKHAHSQVSLSSSARALLRSDIRAAIETSSVPPPPVGTSDLEDVAVPSSPPAVSQSRSEHAIADFSDEEVDLIGSADSPSRLGRDDSVPNKDVIEHKLDGSQVGVEGLPTSTVPNPADASARGIQNRPNAAATVRVPAETDSAAVFDTAQSHLTASSGQRPLSQSSRGKSPRKPGLRRLTEIADEQTPIPSLESVDINNINIITDEDREFLAAMSGAAPLPASTSGSGSSPVPAAKRRKTHLTRPLQEDARNLNICEPAKSAEAQNDPQKGSEDEPPVLPSSNPKEGRKELTKYHVSNQSNKSKSKRPVKRTKPRRVQRRGGRKPSAVEAEPDAVPAVQTAEGERPGTPQTKNPTLSRALSTPDPVLPSVDDTHTPSKDDGLHMPTIADPNSSYSFPDRVLAKFTGNSMAWHPATCLGPSVADSGKFKVRFDSGSVDTLEASQIARLEFRVGDQVKVNLPNMRNKIYIVQGLKDQVQYSSRNGMHKESSAEDYTYSDVYGNRVLQLSVKAPRKSGASENRDTPTVEASVVDVYLTSTMFANFRNRPYYDPLGEGFIRERYMPPATDLSGPATPSNRRLRQGTSMSHHNLQDAFTSPVNKRAPIFANMAFTVSLAGPDHVKTAIVKLLEDHGGSFLDSGFDELFQRVSISETAEKISTAQQLQLQDRAQHLGFTALIADRHSRRAKYMQALALGLPCLHHRWVEDSVAAQAALPTTKYLLPAGASSYLGGAVRSRTHCAHHPLGPHAGLADVLRNRDALLQGKNVLLVSEKPKTEDREKTYAFLALALGAKRVARARDLKHAAEMLRAADWDIVHVPANEQKAEKALLQDAPLVLPARAGKKRKRSEGCAGIGSDARAKRPKVVSDEWVIQSLILGALVD